MKINTNNGICLSFFLLSLLLSVNSYAQNKKVEEVRAAIDEEKQRINAIKRIATLRSEIRSIKRNNKHTFKRGYYVSILGGISVGQAPLGDPQPGLNIDGAAGYHFNQYLGVGAGMSLTTLDRFAFAPIYANLRGYLMKTSASFYYDLNVGYGIPLESPGEFLKKATGGLYLRPAIGFRFASARRCHTVIDFGCIVQTANYDFVDRAGNPVSSEKMFIHPSLRVGVVF